MYTMALITFVGFTISWAVHSSWRYAVVGALAFSGAIVLAIFTYFTFFIMREPAALLNFVTLFALLPVAVYGFGLHRFGPKLWPWVGTLGRGAMGAPIAAGNVLDAVLGRHAVIDSISPEGVIRVRLVGVRARALVAYRLAQIGLFLAVVVWHDEILALFGRGLGRYVRAQVGLG